LNFRICFIIIIFIAGCGVKSNPTSPTKEPPPSLIQELLEENKKKTTKQEKLDN